MLLFSYRKQNHSQDGSYNHPTSLTIRSNAILRLKRNKQTKLFSDELWALNAAKSVAESSRFLLFYSFVDVGVISVDARLTQN